MSIKQKRQSTSQLDSIPGIGEATKKKLLRQFGSLKAIAETSKKDLIDTVGPQKAKLIIGHFTKK